MKTYKSFKKTALFGGLLLITTGLTTLIAVSCSNTSDPQIAVATVFNLQDGDTKHKITINKATVTLEPGVKFSKSDGTEKEYKVLPTLNTDPSQIAVEDQKARVYFTEVLNFTLWLQSFLLSTQNFLGAIPAQMTEFNPSLAIHTDLAYGLSAPLNEGVNTARLGLHNVDFSFNLKNQIDVEFKQYSPDPVTEAWEHKFASSKFTNINLTYNWWTTDKSNVINWKDNNWDVANQKQSLWRNFPVVPKPVYTMKIDDISFDLIQKATKKDDKWINTGVATIVEPEAAFKFGEIVDKPKSQQVVVFLSDADKNRKGDILHGDFKKFVTSPENKEKLDNFAKVLKV